MNKERIQEIFYHVFNGGKKEEEFEKTFTEKETLFENCYVLDYLNSTLIPMAKENGDEEYFLAIGNVLKKVIWKKIKENDVLFTLEDEETGQTVINEGAVYLVYSEEYKEKSQYLYRKLEGADEVVKLMLKNKAEKIIITDGGGNGAILELDKIL